MDRAAENMKLTDVFHFYYVNIQFRGILQVQDLNLILRCFGESRRWREVSQVWKSQTIFPLSWIFENNNTCIIFQWLFEMNLSFPASFGFILHFNLFYLDACTLLPILVSNWLQTACCLLFSSIHYLFKLKKQVFFAM